MNQTLQRLKDIEKNGYQLDFGNVFNDAFENYKKIALYAGLVLIIFGILFTAIIAGFVIAAVGSSLISGGLNPEKLKVENFTESQMLIFNISAIVISCIMSPFQASFLKMALYGERDNEFRISDLFSYYKLPYLTKIVGSTLTISVIGLVQATLFSNIHFELLGGIITYFISFITILTVPLIIFGELDTFNAIKYSILIIFKQPIVILGLIIIAFIGSFVGIMGCCIGIFFTLPFIYSMNYVIYSSIVGIDFQEEIQ
ncbi:hypothetical protein [Flavobacterium aquiphilum]|uniref:hypothetical protein n=1 Tax=Flavobacterium aquiphilum TaxID=3003261 RepID=UPI00247FC4F2|nr:hypothetical protein [Flavobacterium aquiphilum]